MFTPIISGLASYGMSGRIFHAPFLTTNPRFKLKAIVERHEKVVALRYPQVISYNRIEELLADEELELIVVNTPNYTHFDYTIKALKAGKHVLLEKPAANTSNEVRMIYDLSRKVNKQVMLYQNRRWDSGFAQVKQIIESGRLGQIVEVHFRIDRFKRSIGSKSFKENPLIPGSGLPYDLGSHLLDNAICLFGKPNSFIKTIGTYRHESEVADYFHYHLSYPNQLHVFLTSGLLIAEVLPGFAVHGTEGSFVKNRCDVQESQLDLGMSPCDYRFGIEHDGNEGKLVTIDLDNNKKVEFLASSKGNYNGLFNTLYDTVRENKLYPITEEQIIWQLEMLEA